MGMFDEIVCEYPLPDGYVPEKGEEFQTKDLDECMRHYRIDSSGALLRELYRIDEIEPPDPNAKDIGARIFGKRERVHLGWEPVAHHGAIEFYGGDHCYVALYSHGELLSLEVVEERQTVCLTDFDGVFPTSATTTARDAGKDEQ